MENPYRNLFESSSRKVFALSGLIGGQSGFMKGLIVLGMIKPEAISYVEQNIEQFNTEFLKIINITENENNTNNPSAD